MSTILNKNSENFLEVLTFVNEMRNSSSSLHKVNVLEKYKNSAPVRSALFYTYNTFFTFGVTFKSLLKFRGLPIISSNYTSFYALLNALHEKKITGNSAKLELFYFIEGQVPEIRGLLYSIIDRDLNIGCGEKIISKVFVNLIPTFSVALANKPNMNKLDKYLELCDWYESRKLDGVRCITIKIKQNVRFFSREGNEFKCFNVLAKELLQIPGDFVLDGEVCIINEHGIEDFSAIVKEIHKKNHTIANPKLKVFDCLTLDEFNNAKGDVILSERFKREPICLIQELYSKGIMKHIDVLEQTKIESVTQIFEHIKDAQLRGYEGIMLRANLPYEGKRSNNLLKFKKMNDAEYVVIGCTNSNMRFVEDKKSVEIEVLGSITIAHKNGFVDVGSGLSKEQRIYYRDKHNELIGKTVTVQYFEEIETNGIYSLRFPVLKFIYDDKRTF